MELLLSEKDTRWRVSEFDKWEMNITRNVQRYLIGI